MSSARTFLEQQLKRQLSSVSLDAAVLQGRGLAYARARLYLLAPRALLRTLIHGLELWILTLDFPLEFLLPLLTMRTLPAAVSGFHWGALEAMRSSVRTDAHSRAERARASTEAWLVWTSTLCLLGTLLVVGLIGTAETVEAGPFGLYGLFGIVTVVTLSIDLVTRTYYAGVYALGRAYRPSWSFFLPELCEISLLVLMHPALGPFALHAAVLCGALVRCALTLYYARKAYAARSLLRPHPFRLTQLRNIGALRISFATHNALSILPQQLDRVLLLSLLHAPVASETSIPLSLPYYVLRPILNLSQSWTRVFFPDFVRLKATGVHILQERFQRVLARVASFAGIASGVVACAGAFFGFGLEGFYASLYFIPLCVVRSHFSLMQVRDFALGQHQALFRVSLILGLFLAGLSLTHVSDRASLVALVLLLLTAMYVQQRASAAAWQKPARDIGLPRFLSTLCATKAPVRLTLAQFDKRYARAKALLNALEARAPSACITRVGRTRVLWWEPAELALPRAQIVKLGAGAFRHIESVVAPNGMAALFAPNLQAAMPEDLRHALSGPPAAHALLDQVNALAPPTYWLDLSAPSTPLPGLDPRTFVQIRKAILAEAHGRLQQLRSRSVEVAVYAPAGEPRWVFLWQSHTPVVEAAKALIRAASWRDSLHCPSLATPEPASQALRPR